MAQPRQRGERMSTSRERPPVTWVGVALRFADGSVQAVEVDARDLLGVEINHEVVEELRRWDGRISPGPGEYEIRIRSTALTYWQRGAEQAPPPQPAIEEAPKQVG